MRGGVRNRYRQEGNRMTDKTIQEIREEHGAKASGILSGYYAELDAIRGMREPEEGAYLERLSDGERFGLLMEQKATRANEARRRTVDAYRREHEAYQEEVRARAGYVEGKLFGMSSPESAAVLSRAALASEEELGTMLDLAKASGNHELATAALVGAERRGFAELVVRALEHAGDETRGLYHEWAERPPDEVLARQAEQAEAIVERPSPERLAGPPPLDR